MDSKNKAEKLVGDFNKARRLLAKSRNRARDTEIQIIRVIQDVQATFIRDHVFPSMYNMATKLRQIQFEQASALPDVEHNVPPAKLIEGRAKIPYLQIAPVEFQAYGYISFITKTDSKQNSFFVGFDDVDKIDDNFLPPLMADGVDTVKFLRWIKEDPTGEFMKW